MSFVKELFSQGHQPATPPETVGASHIPDSGRHELIPMAENRGHLLYNAAYNVAPHGTKVGIDVLSLITHAPEWNPAAHDPAMQSAQAATMAAEAAPPPMPPQQHELLDDALAYAYNPVAEAEAIARQAAAPSVVPTSPVPPAPVADGSPSEQFFGSEWHMPPAAAQQHEAPAPMPVQDIAPWNEPYEAGIGDVAPVDNIIRVAEDMAADARRQLAEMGN